MATDISKLKGQSADNGAEQLNQGCFCVTLDDGALAKVNRPGTAGGHLV
jgi:hypothetical protein